MTNFVYISPAYPATSAEFCIHLARSGVCVLGIGDGPYEELPRPLIGALSEYYRVNSLEDYDQAYRATAYFAHRYGRIDWLESNNEYWLELDAKLRTDFNVPTGEKTDRMTRLRSKAAMKPVYASVGIPAPRQIPLTTKSAAADFIKQVGYPVIVKPEFGVGAAHTRRLTSDEDLDALFSALPADPYVVEQFVYGDIYSYDGIIGSGPEPMFEAATRWPPSIMDIVHQDLDLSYRVLDRIPAQLRDYGRRTLRAFGVQHRFFHLEFFRLRTDQPGLGRRGDFVALEVNMRPAGGVTVDMYNYARAADAYQIYADMVTGNDTGAAAKMASDAQICVYAARRDNHRYRIPREHILATYQSELVRVGRNPELFVPQMGNEFFILRTASSALADQFEADVLARAEEHARSAPRH